MSTVTVHITQNVAISRTTAGPDPSEISGAVADVIQRELLPATGLDWSTLAVTVDSGA